MGKSRKINISLKRRLFIYYSYLLNFSKISLVILLYLLFWTNYFSGIKENIRQQFYNFTASNGFILENLVIAGQNNLKRQQVVNAIKASRGTPLFAVNLNNIKTKIKANPWVRSVSVARHLPKTIYINIIEKQPVALWQVKKTLYLIDHEGEIISEVASETISAPSNRKFTQLLHVIGDDANLYAHTLIKEINKYPDLAKHILSATRYGERRWDLNLAQNITVKMAELNFQDGYNHLYALYTKNKLFKSQYKIIDLRDPQKFYFE